MVPESLRATRAGLKLGWTRSGLVGDYGGAAWAKNGARQSMKIVCGSQRDGRTDLARWIRASTSIHSPETRSHELTPETLFHPPGPPACPANRGLSSYTLAMCQHCDTCNRIIPQGRMCQTRPFHLGPESWQYPAFGPDEPGTPSLCCNSGPLQAGTTFPCPDPISRAARAKILKRLTQGLIR
jgi:hypothetical protein